MPTLPAQFHAALDLALALGHAVARERAPLAGLAARLQRWQQSPLRHGAGWVTLAALPVGVLMMASLISVELRVPARGELQPAVRRDIFAYDDGVVERVLVQHGDQVHEGQLLIELTQSELEYSISQLDGQLRTAQQQLQAVTARRWDANASPGRGHDIPWRRQWRSTNEWLRGVRSEAPKLHSLATRFFRERVAGS